MLAKTSSVQQQQQPRRTPLSLSTTIKPSKPNEKNDNNKKETTNNQKTENSKKDSQPEKKLSSDKKQSSTESKRSSSTSSTDSKKLEGNNKVNKNEDNKKSQNGVNGNGIKDKPNTPNANEGVTKTKPEPSSNGSASKKDIQKPIEKKKDPVVEVTTKNENKDKPAEKNKETKNEENKNKSADKNKEKTVEVSNNKNLDLEKRDEIKDLDEKKNNVEKVDEEKSTEIKSPEKTAAKETNVIEKEVTIVDPESGEGKSTLTTEITEETTVVKTPIKEKKDEETPKPLPEHVLEDVVMMEPLQFIEEPTCNIFAVSTPAKRCSPKEAQHLFEVPSKLSPKSEVKPARAPLTHTPDRKSCPRTFSSISGRRSIRPIGDYTFSGNLQIRESYRKINTELDFTSSSLNVTVGSEVPNNESFSFFSRSRKRDRSSPCLQSAMEVQSELSTKSPKRARIDIGMNGFFNAMASPITMLRARLARASVQSTPKKQIVDPIEQEIVENVSAIAVEAVDEELTATEEQIFNPDSTVADTNEKCEKPAKCPAFEEMDDIKIKETITATDSQTKKKCSIM